MYQYDSHNKYVIPLPTVRTSLFTLQFIKFKSEEGYLYTMIF